MKKWVEIIGISLLVSCFGFLAFQPARADVNNVINVTVRDDGGNLVNAQVNAYNVTTADSFSGDTQSDGVLSSTVEDGEWVVSVDANLSESNPDNYPWMYSGKSETFTFSQDGVVETADLSFTVTRATSLVTATYRDTDNSLLITGVAADVSFTRSDGISTRRKVDSTTGTVSVYLLPGIYRIWADSAQIGDTETLADYTFVVKEGENKELGTIYVIEKGSIISGILIDQNGAIVTGKQLLFRRKGAPERLYQDVQGDGTFNRHVGPGEYSITFSDIGDNVDYVLSSGINVTVETNAETVSLGNVVALNKNMSIDGEIRYNNVAITNFSGTVVAKTTDGAESFYTKVESNGHFSLKLPTAKATTSTLSMDIITQPGSGYYLRDPVTVAVQAGTVPQNFNMDSENATISGTITDQDGNAVTNAGTDIEVVAISNNGSSEKTEVDASGNYSLSVPEGDWVVGVYLEDEEAAEVIKPAGSYNEATTTPSNTTTLNIPVAEKEATISGTVVDELGQPVAQTPVTVTNMGINSITSDESIIVSTTTDTSGNYTVEVPAGDFSVSVGSTPEVTDLIEPVIQEVTVAVGETKDTDMQYQAADATVTGTISAAATITEATVVAYSEDGGYAESEVASDGSYSLSLNQGEWNVVASGLVNGELYVSEKDTLTVTTGANTENLAMAATGQNVPSSVTTTENASELAVVGNEKGVTAIIEPYGAALTSTVSVDLMAVPEVIMTAEGVQTGISYELEVLNGDNSVTQMKLPATIIMPTEETTVTGETIDEDALTTQYWSPEEESWQPDGVTSIVDKDNNQVIVQADHVTRFSVNNVTSTMAATLNETPDQITNVKVPDKHRKATRVKVKWTADAKSASYKVQLRTKAGVKVKNFTTTNNYKVIRNNLLSNKAYKVRVRGINASETEGAWSEYENFRTKPAKVTKLRIIDILSDSGTVNFKKPRGVINKYVITVYKKKNKIATYKILKKTSATWQSKAINGLSSGFEYTVKVQAIFNKNNKSLWAIKKFSTL